MKLFWSVQWYHSLNILFLVWYLDSFRIWWVYCCSMKLLCNVVFRFLWPVRAVKCCLPFYWRSVVVFVGFDFGMCSWLWYFEGFLVGLLYVRCSGTVWFVFRLSCEIVWNIWACLLGEWFSQGSDTFFWTLLLREIQDNLYILIVMYEIQKCIYSINNKFKQWINKTKNSSVSDGN